MLAEAVAPRMRGRAAAALQAGEPVGVAIAAIVGYLLLPRVGWRAVLDRVERHGAPRGRRARVGAPAERSRRSTVAPAELRAAVRVPGLVRRFAAAWLLGVFKLGTYWSCYTWLPTFLSHGMHQSVGRSLTWMVTAQTGQLVGMLTFGAISDRVGRRPAFALYSLLTAAAIAPLAFAWSALLPHPALFWTAMLALGVGSGCTAGFGALLAELFPTEVRGAAMGTTYNLARAAQLLTPLLVGGDGRAPRARRRPGVPCVLALATASWVWVLPETRGIELPRLTRYS